MARSRVRDPPKARKWPVCVMNNTLTGHNTFIFLFPTRPRAFFLALICSGCDGPWWADPRVYQRYLPLHPVSLYPVKLSSLLSCEWGNKIVLPSAVSFAFCSFFPLFFLSTEESSVVLLCMYSRLIIILYYILGLMRQRVNCCSSLCYFCPPSPCSLLLRTRLFLCTLPMPSVVLMVPFPPASRFG